MPVTAFKDPATGKLTIITINARSSSQVLNVRLNGMSAATMTPYTTSATQDLAAGTALNATGR